MDCPHLEESARVTTPCDSDEKSLNIPSHLKCTGIDLFCVSMNLYKNDEEENAFLRICVNGREVNLTFFSIGRLPVVR